MTLFTTGDVYGFTNCCENCSNILLVDALQMAMYDHIKFLTNGTVSSGFGQARGLLRDARAGARIGV